MLVRIEVQNWRRICGRHFEIGRNGTENGGAIPAAEVSDLRRRGDCGSIVVTRPGPVMFKPLRVGRNGHASRCPNLGRCISIVQHMPNRQSPRTIRALRQSEAGCATPVTPPAANRKELDQARTSEKHAMAIRIATTYHLTTMKTANSAQRGERTSAREYGGQSGDHAKPARSSYALALTRSRGKYKGMLIQSCSSPRFKARYYACSTD